MMKKQHINMDERIKSLLAESPLVALYFSVGIGILKEKIDSLANEEISEMFEKLLHSQRVRNNVDYIYKKLNNLD